MWDLLRTTSSSAITVPEETRFENHAKSGGIHKHSVAQKRIRILRPSRTRRLEFDTDNFLEPLDTWGTSHNTAGTSRYAIQRGKVVPRHTNVDIILPSQNGFGSMYSHTAPPRRSSRRKPRQHSISRLRSDSAWRPASSVYDNSDSESPPDTRQYKLESSNEVGGIAADQISPPSSPEAYAVQTQYTAGDVSPLDEEFDHTRQFPLREDRSATHRLPSQVQRTGRTGQPTPNSGDQRGDDGAVIQPLRLAGGRAWNDQVHTGRVLAAPGGDAMRHHRRPVPPSDSNTPVRSPENTQMNASSPSPGQKSRLSGKAKPESLDNRPPWNGASGRSALVEPVRDNFNVVPLSIPRKSSKRPGRSGRTSAGAAASGTSAVGSAGSAMRKFLPLASKHKTKKSTASLTQSSTENPLREAADSYPSPPQIDSPVPDSNSRDTPPPSWHNKSLASHPPESLPSSANAIKRKPPPGSAQINTASNYLGHKVKSSNGVESSAAPVSSSPARVDNTWVQPPSRFSITTYATSNAGTPRQSAEDPSPPMPTMPPGVSVMNRSRPVVSDRGTSSNSEAPVTIALSSPYMPVESSQARPVASQAQSQHQRATSDMNSEDCRASTLSMSKPLPPAPPEISLADDPVSQLNARINGLAHRRANIEKSIKQMTELMPQDNLLASDQVLRKREEEKQKVDGLREELAEIQRDEYDLGLKLFRAYKRQNKDAEYEPTTLWVRRVAG